MDFILMVKKMALINIILKDKMNIKYILVLLINFNIFGQGTLDKLAVFFQTDKSSKHHNYANIYEQYFSRLKNSRINFLEIGFKKGSSAKMWEKYFTNANLHFIDINKSFLETYGKQMSNRVKLHLIDQSNAMDLREFGQRYGKFDIIIDDGGHTMNQQITSFKSLFPYVKPGGVYIVEDLHTSYWKEDHGEIYNGGGSRKNPFAGSNTMIGFLKKLVDDVNFIGARTGKADKNKCPKNIFNNLNIYRKKISSMHFYDSLCFIFKVK